MRLCLKLERTQQCTASSALTQSQAWRRLNWIFRSCFAARKVSRSAHKAKSSPPPRAAAVVVVADSSRKYNAISFQFNSRLKLQTSLREDKVWWKRARSQPLNWNKNANLGAKKGSSPDAGSEWSNYVCRQREICSHSSNGCLSCCHLKYRANESRPGVYVIRVKTVMEKLIIHKSLFPWRLFCVSRRVGESESERASERADVEERVRREPRARRAAAGASERKSVRYEGEKPRLERK